MALENADTEAPWPQLVHCDPAPPPSTARNEVPSSSARPRIVRAPPYVRSAGPMSDNQCRGDTVPSGPRDPAPTGPGRGAEKLGEAGQRLCERRPPSVSERSTRCPLSVRCEPASRGVSSRAVTAATASAAAARPKRASQSF